MSALALELRYTLNAKKVSASKLSKKKERDKVRNLFNGNHSTGQRGSDNLAEKLKKLNDYFMNR
ncbi:hypothetical protein ABID29_001832 [Streptococcus rupicaprae]|uniref:Phage protein n=1 Tax=Streptococcus rupicaprae TaxID=759619 RepID=A0ABV2FJF4_9STRE